MDFIELLILLIIFLAPAIGRLFGKKPPAPSPTEPRPASHEDDPFGEALRQIREALGEPAPEPAPAPKPVPAAQRLEKARPAPDFHGLGSLDRDERSLERRRPVPVENLERLPVVAEPVRPAPPKRVPLPKPTAPALRTRDFVHRLRDPQRAREAFILHEVFGPPRSRRR